MRKHSKVILLAEEQLVFGRSLPKMVGERQSPERRAGKPFARIARCKDRTKKGGASAAHKPVGRVN
jgi:hypothetical protein